MARYKIVTLIGFSTDATAQDGTNMLTALRGARPDLFGPDNEVIDFHMERYVVLHTDDEADAAQAWAASHGVRLHGAILSRGDAYDLYVGWTGLLDSTLG